MFLLYLLLVTVVALHLAAAGVASVSPLVCVWLEWRGARSLGHAGRLDEATTWAARRMALDSLWLLGIAAILGSVALGLLYVMGWEAYFRAAAAVPVSRLAWGLAELLFSAACMAAFLWMRLPRWARGGLAIVGSTNLLYHFPLLFSSIVVISKRPDLWDRTLSGQQMRTILFSSETLSRATHFTLAAATLTGLLLCTYSLRLSRLNFPPELTRRIATWGARLSLAAAILQIPAGALLFVVMPANLRERIMFGDPLATTALAAAVLTVVGLLHHLLAMSLGEHGRKQIVRTLSLAGAVMLLMVLVSHRLRDMRAPAAGPSASPPSASSDFASRTSALVKRISHVEGEPTMTTIITLRDESTGASAQIAPERGFNCFSFQPVVGGRDGVGGEAVQVLWAAEDFSSGKARASGTGIPLLFPFPGRLRGKTFSFGGQSHEFTEYQDGRGNAIHGLVLERPWEVVEKSDRHVVGRFEPSRQKPPLAQWPADFRLTVSYTLQGNTLASEILIENTDTRPLPWGFGTHPYFRVPLGKVGDPAGEDAARCVVTVPNSGYWELKDMLPTGRKLPADDKRGLAQGKTFRDTQLDDILTDLKTAQGRCVTTIHDPKNRRTLTMRFDEIFTQCVVYNPGHRQAICIEPYTCVPGLAAEPGAQQGQTLAVLQPGKSQRARIEIELKQQ